MAKGKKSSEAEVKARPFLKWVGGKRQLIPKLLPRVPEEFGNYHEPFVGGGALFFELASEGLIQKAFISDTNSDLIDAYSSVRNDVEKLIVALKKHKYNKDHYYKTRAIVPSVLSKIERAARLIYLNRSCFNGLYRVNLKGQFNVPFGRYTNPIICDEENLRACSKLLQKATIKHESYEAVLDRADKDDFVYFDPPYVPVSKTSNFSAYSEKGFGRGDHQKLRDLFFSLHKKDCWVMLSNSDTPFTRELYRNFFETLDARRAVNSKSSGRGAVKELLVRNYEQNRKNQGT